MEPYRLAHSEEPTAVVEFWLKHERLDPQYVTAALGVPPTVAWAKGERPSHDIGQRLAPRRFGAWCLAASASRRDPIIAQLGVLLDQLGQLPPIVRELTREYGGFISVGYSSGEGAIGFLLARDTLARLSDLGLAIDFNIYPVAVPVEDQAEEAQADRSMTHEQ